MIGLFISIPIILLQVILIFKFFRRESKYQQELEKRNKFIESLQQKISEAVITLKSQDYLGAFEADDEVGAYLRNLKEMQEAILEFFKTDIHE